MAGRNARHPKINTSSKYRGVWYNKQKKKWRATIVVNLKTKQLGYFHDEIEAAKAYVIMFYTLLFCFYNIVMPETLGYMITWTKGFDKRYCFDEKSLGRRINYVNSHSKG